MVEPPFHALQLAFLVILHRPSRVDSPVNPCSFSWEMYTRGEFVFYFFQIHPPNYTDQSYCTPPDFKFEEEETTEQGNFVVCPG